MTPEQWIRAEVEGLCRQLQLVRQERDEAVKAWQTAWRERDEARAELATYKGCYAQTFVLQGQVSDLTTRAHQLERERDTLKALLRECAGWLDLADWERPDHARVELLTRLHAALT